MRQLWLKGLIWTDCDGLFDSPQLSDRKKKEWAQPPVPTELITVGKPRTGSVQQEPELGPLLHQADARYPSILLCTLQSDTRGKTVMGEGFSLGFKLIPEAELFQAMISLSK